MSTTLILLTLFISAGFGRVYYQNEQVPELGVQQGQFKPLNNTPNNVSTQTDDDRKKVEPLMAKATIEETMAAIKATLVRTGNAQIITETNDYLYAVFRTPLMKFKDDVEFWIDMKNGVVHFRSSSRAGKSDLGLNRKRYDRIAELYQDHTVRTK